MAEPPKRVHNRVAARLARQAQGLVTRVLRLRLKDKHAAFLLKKAAAVNFCWNYANELSFKKLQREGVFMTSGDLHEYTKGASKTELALHSQTIQAVNEEFVTRRRQFKKAKLRWRVSYGARRSLGWIPFKQSALAYRNGQVWFGGIALSLWDSYGLADYELGAGTLSEDARGRWYLNVTVKVKKAPAPVPLSVSEQALGIDLGLKSLMADSQGRTVEAPQFYRDLEPALARAQRARKVGRTRTIHAKVANRRRDYLHKLSTAQVRAHRAIFVGNVNAQALTQTSMAKSVLDAGWSRYRTMLQYKSDSAGVWFKEIDESYSTQECSNCHARTGPRGLTGLAERRWTCSACGAEHDRDTNSACVIRQRGLRWLAEQFSTPDSSAPGAAAEVNKGGPSGLTAPGHGRPAVGIPVL